MSTRDENLRALGFAGPDDRSGQDPSSPNFSMSYKDIVGITNGSLRTWRTNLSDPAPAEILQSTGDDYEFLFNSYSGSDVQIFLLMDVADAAGRTRNFRPFREIQTLSISAARSVHPVRRLGESHVTEYTRGARTIAGTMVCATGTLDVFGGVGSRSRREKASQTPFFVDEVPSFSVLITCVNEYGQSSHAALTDVTLSNYGTNFSSDDMYLESTYTYVARFYHPLLRDPKLLNMMMARGRSNKLSVAVRSPGTVVYPAASTYGSVDANPYADHHVVMPEALSQEESRKAAEWARKNGKKP